MGDRGNIKVVDGWKGETYPPVFLYAHWGGSDLLSVVHSVLSRQERWNDAPYLTRMLFCKMVEGRESDSIGFGISSRLCDNEHLIVVVDCQTMRVYLEGENGEREDNYAGGKEGWEFKDFVKLLPEQVKSLNY